MEEQSVQCSITDINSEEPAKSEVLQSDQPRKNRICLIGDIRNNSLISAAAQKFGVPVLTSDTGIEYSGDDKVYCTYFVLQSFDGSVYEALPKKSHRILGPTALLQLANRGDALPRIHRPMYSISLLGKVIVFTGFRNKSELSSLVHKIHGMGGSIKNEMSERVTHLIANCYASDDKYKYALIFKLSIMSKNWIDQLWEERDNPIIFGDNEAITSRNKLPLFFNSKICFFGFPEEEKIHMVEVLEQQGGTPIDINGPECTHVVVDESNSNILQELGKMDVVKGDSVASSCRRRAQIVKAEWFWTSVQNQDIAHERDYKINLESVMSPSAFARRDSQQTSTPTSASTKRKRKRFPENIVSLIQNAESPTVYKRRSSISDAGFLSVSGSFLDATASPDKHALDEVEAANTGPKKDKPRRYPVFLELLNTEKNYVEILNAIITFQKQLDDLIDTPGELINATERKLIFGNVSIIHDTHKKMLEEFKHHCTNWKDDTSIGAIYLSHLPGLVKVYPPYINFLSNAYETLKKLDAERPRFHAFLKICQSKPQSQRQPLHELLLRPFQRLGSTILLLEEIHRHTDINNPDHSSLKLAIEGLKKATSHVDEDKRKTEEQVSIFCIFNDIDNCPAYLVSSHRSFIDKYEVIDLNKDLSGRGTHLTLFLFSDTLEICKKKSKFNSLKSPNMMNGTNIVNGSNTMTKHNQEKLYRHVEMLSLRDVKKVFDIQETEGCSNVFALKVRSNQEIKEKLFSFAMTDERSNKTNFLKSLCRQMANTICIADADIFLISLHSSDLKIDTSEVATGTLGKAFKFATKTKKNLTRALSINKTPSKLKRAMSTMMSPFGSTTSLSHSTSLTPISGLAGMRLASCNNMNELAKGETDSPSSRDNVLVAPMSVQPTRKAKCGTLSMASLRRL
ncbi:protein ECT2 isoform X2 [Aphidius gifuensis]|uniref:protein ECT2 isoform X2 n=1 Tax=Aphidius gifuensis TaxID=684658 RepID=UPI001CDCB24D|nr:protein ECT2 isoform X2 [Aphidius gifuensis]